MTFSVVGETTLSSAPGSVGSTHRPPMNSLSQLRTAIVAAVVMRAPLEDIGSRQREHCHDICQPFDMQAQVVNMQFAEVAVRSIAANDAGAERRTS
jgi:hypothetical protein